MGIFTKTLIEGEEIKDYIPQREPVVMVDAFYGIDDNKSFSGLMIKKESVFTENGFLSEAGIIEHIAQSCAIRIGYLYRRKQLPIPTGYIAAIKNLKIMTLPEAGQQLFTTVTVLQEVFDITLVSVEVKANRTPVAMGEMKIFVSNGK